MTDVEHISRKGTGVPVSWFPVPEEGELPENLQGLFRKAREMVGFVPNVFRAYSYRPDRLSAWFAHYRQLHEPASTSAARPYWTSPSRSRSDRWIVTRKTSSASRDSG